MTGAKPITVAYGDGIGPEIMEATLAILAEAKARLSIETITIGEKLYKFGSINGIPDEAWVSLRRTGILLKAPVTIPEGDSYKNLNDTLCTTLGLKEHHSFDIGTEKITTSSYLASTSSIGEDYAMFEALHGSAPDIAGKDIANPSAMLGAAIMMLIHIGQPDVATRVHNAWLSTLEASIFTADMPTEITKMHVGTHEFAHAVMERMDETPKTLKAANYIAPQDEISKS